MQAAGVQIDQQTIANLLQLGGQYALPTAALLRALYSGYRGKLPEGIGQIAAASVFAGLTAVADNRQPDLMSIVAELAGNTIFVAGLLSFIVIYLLRLPNFGWVLDVIVGGFLGGAAWGVWVYVLNNSDLPLWTVGLAIAGGAIAFLILRWLMRHILRLVRIASFFIGIGLLFIVGAGGLYLLQQYAGVTLPIGR